MEAQHQSSTVMEASPCRTCMSKENQLHYLFYNFKLMNRTLPEIIDYVAEVKVDEADELPNFICTECINLAKSALLFKEQCQRSEAVFKEVINRNRCAENTLTIKKIEHSISIDTDTNNVYQSDTKKKTSRSQKAFQTIEEKKFKPYQRNDAENRIDLKDTKMSPARSSPSVYSCGKCHTKFNIKRKFITHSAMCEIKKTFSESIAEQVGCDLTSKRGKLDSVEHDENETGPKVLISKRDNLDPDYTPPGVKINKLRKLTKKHRNGPSKTKKEQKQQEITECDEVFDESEVENNEVFSCTICPKTFARRRALTMHAMHHRSVKKYLCTYCDKCFYVLSRLKDHIRTHKGETPFSSTICDKEFKTVRCFVKNKKGHTEERTHIKKRTRRHNTERAFDNKKNDLFFPKHKHSDEKSYVCSICDSAFKRNSALACHLKIHDSVDVEQEMIENENETLKLPNLEITIEPMQITEERVENPSSVNLITTNSEYIH